MAAATGTLGEGTVTSQNIPDLLSGDNLVAEGNHTVWIHLISHITMGAEKKPQWQWVPQVSEKVAKTS